MYLITLRMMKMNNEWLGRRYHYGVIGEDLQQALAKELESRVAEEISEYFNDCVDDKKVEDIIDKMICDNGEEGCVAWILALLRRARERKLLRGQIIVEEELPVGARQDLDSPWCEGFECVWCTRSARVWIGADYGNKEMHGP